ncbi:MAG: NAD-dependent epimerase/dehydratase family protein [Phycisphaerales bacterium]|nr:NAD-dependent epimerase/dehydratase family protein [Phycisphaerales bacterium]
MGSQETDKRRWFITGGCGFIGSNLIESLVADGCPVRVYDNLTVGTREALAAVTPFDEVEADAAWSEGVQLVVGDILECDVLAAAAKDGDVIVHLAACTGVPDSVRDPHFDCRTNVQGTLNALEAARHGSAKRFIFASSGAPAGNVEPPIHEEIVPKPVAPYGASKLAGEAYCSAYAQTFDVETVALRFGNVYGPKSGHKTSVVAKWIGLALEGKPIEIYGDGTATRDFIFTTDLIDAIHKAATAPAENVSGEVFQIATSHETTVGELAELLCTALAEAGIDPPQVRFTEERLGDIKRNYSDTSKAAELLAWKPVTSLQTGLLHVLEPLLYRNASN